MTSYLYNILYFEFPNTILYTNQFDGPSEVLTAVLLEINFWM